MRIPIEDLKKVFALLPDASKRYCPVFYKALFIPGKVVSFGQVVPGPEDKPIELTFIRNAKTQSWDLDI